MAATRQRLLDAAVELMIEEGSVGITTGRLTSQAGVVQSAFYNHFASVEECKVAALAEVRARVTEATELIFDEVSTPDTSASADIDRILLEIFDQATTRPAQFGLLTHRSHTPDVTVVIEDVLTELRSAMVRAIRDESSRLSHLSVDTATVAASLLVGTFLGALKQVLDGADAARMAAATSHFMTGGLFALAASDPSTLDG